MNRTVGVNEIDFNFLHKGNINFTTYLSVIIITHGDQVMLETLLL